MDNPYRNNLHDLDLKYTEVLKAELEHAARKTHCLNETLARIANIGEALLRLLESR